MLLAFPQLRFRDDFLLFNPFRLVAILAGSSLDTELQLSLLIILFAGL